MAKRKQKTPHRDPIAALVQQVELKDLRLVACRSKFAPKRSAPPSDLAQRINVHSSEIEAEGGRHLVCIITLTLADVPAGGSLPSDSQANAGNLFIIEGAFQLVYSLATGSFTQTQLEEFGQRNALHNVWPYWREFVQTMTSRMGLPPLKIPLMRPVGLKFTRDEHEKPAPARKRKGTKGRKR